MKLAVMQPYLFPYIGYYQLAYYSDFFIFYDDVTYIKNGYINRNKILTKNGEQLFTIPVNNASSFSLINNLYFTDNVKKILSTIQQAYSKAPYYSEVYPIIERVLSSEDRNVSHLASLSIISVFEYLDVKFNYTYSSMIEYDNDKNAKDKLYEFCNIFNAKEYVNTIGGVELYNKEEFNANGITLEFIESGEIKYCQSNNKNGFVKNLSILDILMNESKSSVIDKLNIFNIR